MNDKHILLPALKFHRRWKIKSCNQIAATLLDSDPATLPGTDFDSLCRDFKNWTSVNDDDVREGNVVCIQRDIKLTSAQGRAFWARAQMRMHSKKGGTLYPLDMTFIDVDDLYRRNQPPAAPDVMVDPILTTADDACRHERMADKASMSSSEVTENPLNTPRNTIAGGGNHSRGHSLQREDRDPVAGPVDEESSQVEPFEQEVRIRTFGDAERGIRDQDAPKFDKNDNFLHGIRHAQDISDADTTLYGPETKPHENYNSEYLDNFIHTFNNIMSIIIIDCAISKTTSDLQKIRILIDKIVSQTNRATQYVAAEALSIRMNLSGK